MVKSVSYPSTSLDLETDIDLPPEVRLQVDSIIDMMDIDDDGQDSSWAFDEQTGAIGDGYDLDVDKFVSAEDLKNLVEAERSAPVMIHYDYNRDQMVTRLEHMNNGQKQHSVVETPPEESLFVDRIIQGLLTLKD